MELGQELIPGARLEDALPLQGRQQRRHALQVTRRRVADALCQRQGLGLRLRGAVRTPGGTAMA